MYFAGYKLVLFFILETTGCSAFPTKVFHNNLRIVRVPIGTGSKPGHWTELWTEL